MARIAVLASSVVDQIAAGEVVERPASVVKELVENSFDAAATSVDIAIEEGGRACIRVADDGAGMDREDAILALERHATSKIRGASDLVGVASFGFRGEALPAIASVAQLDVETSLADGTGTLVRTLGGAMVDVADAARRRGTTVTVSRLFFNTPARQKFLRSTRSEWRGIVDVVTTLALIRRDVRVGLSHDGRVSLALPAAPTLRARLAAIWGSRTAERMVAVDDVHGVIHVSGLVERPSDVGTATRRVFISVNGRAIRDAGIVRSAEAAYRSTIPSGARPSIFLDLILPADSVDVNVHPAKVEVRFRDRWQVERAVEGAVRRALGTRESAAGFGAGRRLWTSAEPSDNGVPVGLEVLSHRPSNADGPLLESVGDTSATLEGTTAAHAENAVEVPPLIQLRHTYLMFEHADGLVLIDQHSAHERILYESFMHALESGTLPSQRLLFPLTIHLSAAEGDAFDEHRASLERLGFEIEAFGGNTVIVSSVAMPHPRFDAERCLRDTLAALAGDRITASAGRHEKLAATLACKAAIKAGEPLSPAEMRALYSALARTALPAHDVHGRSTIVQLAWEEVERRFGRK
ncbi:MAG: DNA mismatch repair endonuclease MutL [Gemmatimonadaceae bacterium]